MRHLIDPMDLTVEEIDRLLKTGDDIIDHPEMYAHICEGKKLATLFYEPSTRTRLSFESAMLSLGGTVLGFSSASSSSATKGETIEDTARVVGCFADIIAMRHPKDGAPLVASQYSPVPIINGGDGGHQHPTQTLADMMSIHRIKGHLDNLTIGLCGDLKFGRTVHSLIAAMSRYENVHFILIAPEELRLPSYVKERFLDKNNIPYTEVECLDDVMPQLDILYMTRIQKERFASEEEYERLKDCYILDPQKLVSAKPDLCILHPLPRVNEITPEVDKDPRACYFKQVFFGKVIRMSLILNLLGLGTLDVNRPCKKEKEPIKIDSMVCNNPHCITTIERGLPQMFTETEDHGVYRCAYCEAAQQK